MKAIIQDIDEARAVTILRALANPIRFRIVQILAKQDACVCGDLVSELPVAQSTVSEHLKVLKDAGIVQGVVEGPNRCYCLNPAAIRFLGGEILSLAEPGCG